MNPSGKPRVGDTPLWTDSIVSSIWALYGPQKYPNLSTMRVPPISVNRVTCRSAVSAVERRSGGACVGCNKP